MTYKKYLSILGSLILLYLIFHLTIWNFYSKTIFDLTPKESVGDLARLSYRTDMIHKRTLQYTLKKSHLYKKNFKNQKLDLITIGDSFSCGGGYGKNPYYQDYLASKYNINVLNVAPQNIADFMEAAVNLHNNGFLKKHHVKYLLLESVVHLNLERFARQIDWNQNSKITIRDKTTNIYHQNIKPVNVVNYKMLSAKIKHKLLNKNYTNGIYNFPLTKELFSLKKQSILIYYHGIETLPLYTQEHISLINQNMNKLAKILKEDGVTLIFMPVVDKYDLYYPYLKENPYGKNLYFTFLRKEPKEYLLLDTKKILEKQLTKDEKDLFYIDDTHWNYKASEAISDALLFHEIFENKVQRGKKLNAI